MTTLHMTIADFFDDQVVAAHLAAGHLAVYADKMPTIRGTNLAHDQK